LFLGFVQALFLSPKNSVEGALEVLAAAKCDIWVKPREQAYLPMVEDFLQQRSMQVLEIPELDELLDAESAEFFPYSKTFDEASRDPFCVLHTSGSTGLPKPVSWSHGLIGTMDAVRLLPPTEGDDGLAPWTSLWKEGDRLYSSFPMSHVCIFVPDSSGQLLANYMMFEIYREPVLSWISFCLPSSAFTAFWVLQVFRPTWTW
jgi:acyl-CoA synthetase (AMP-forming)/AMP-acid ligase II